MIDDDVRSNLRHLCNECVDYLRAKVAPTDYPIEEARLVELEAPRIDLALRVLKELGIPPPGE